MEQLEAQTLAVKNICAYYGKKLILKNISVAVKAGKLTCLCGPNGSGKSTLLSILSGTTDPELKILEGTGSRQLNTPDSINALGLAKMPRKNAARITAFMQQNEFSTWNFTAKELVLQGRYCHTANGSYSATDEKLAVEALDKLDILELGDRPVHSLSGGEFQKVRIARAICQQSKFILLDEPAANLDFVYEPRLLKKLADYAHQTGTGIIISIHDVNMTSSCADELILLPLLQQPICGKIKDVLTLENLKITYGMEFECQKVNYFQSLL